VDAGERRGSPGRAGLDLAPLSRVLVVNAGSTSLKLSLVDADDTSEAVEDFVPADAVGHRIVHLGDLAVDAALVDDTLIDYIEEGVEVAPLHNLPALSALRRAQAALPDVPHVAVSDSDFHRTMTPEAREYAIPRDWRDSFGIVRHGFHGLAVAWVAEQVRARRLVVCHLGGGCSVTAVADGRSLDTSMGLTPLEGPPMGTRSGSIDPGALLYLLRHDVEVGELDRVLNEESGLAALGGLDEPFARSHFTYHLAKAVAGMAAALGGLDAIAFSGGIGENRPEVRDAITSRLGFLGSFDVHVVPVREDVVVARAVRRLLAVT
jgi:acetate kinase